MQQSDQVHAVPPSPSESKRPKLEYNLFDVVWIALYNRTKPSQLVQGRVVTKFTLPYETPVYYVIDVLGVPEWRYKEVRTIWQMTDSADGVLMDWEDDDKILAEFAKEAHNPRLLREFEEVFPTPGSIPQEPA